MLKQWNNLIPRKDRSLKLTDKVCSLHFEESAIDRFYEIKLEDGSTFKSEKLKFTLRKGACPTIFPNCPKYLSKPVVKLRNPKKRKFESGNDTHEKKRGKSFGELSEYSRFYSAILLFNKSHEF